MNMCDKTKVLPSWGPYSKKYMGVARAVSRNGVNTSGARFDLVVFPTIAFSGVRPPNSVLPSGYHPWDAAGDLSYYKYRYELEGKDTVYADVEVARKDDDTAIVRVDFHNNSTIKQNCLLNLFSSMEYRDYQYAYIEKTVDTVCWDALDYEEYCYANPRPWDGLNPDGTKKGEFLDSRFTFGHGLGDRVNREYVINVPEKAFGYDAGDRVRYCQPIQDLDDGVLLVRYRTPEATDAEFDVITVCRGIRKKIRYTFPSSKELTFARIPLHFMRFGDVTVELISAGTGGIELDCFMLTEARNVEKVSVLDRTRNAHPSMIDEANGEYIYQYEDIWEEYHIKTFAEHRLERSICSGCLEDAIVYRLSSPYTLTSDMQKPHTGAFSRKEEKGYFHNVMLHSIFVEPGESRSEYVAVSIKDLSGITQKDCAAVIESAREMVEPVRYTKDGNAFEFSNQLLRAAALTNVVYPIYCQGKFVHHFTPGKRWDSVYTWDSGFIGLGFLETNPYLSEYILDMYLSKEDNLDYAFLNHGSPVPIMIILLYEMMQRTENKNSLAGYYSRAKRFYEFLAGRRDGSTTAKFKTGLTNTYDYYYNASGMDDLPAQLHVFHCGLQSTVAPVVSASMLILSAKILSQIADKIGCKEDKEVYETDIQRLSNALQTYSWDEESGYYSYVVHDEKGGFKCRLTTENGENFNKGMEGCLPLLAGICTSEQRERIYGHIMSPKEMFSPIGISAVDMSSSYYTGNGYWNGCVWFPYQWLLWKALLDSGNGELAFKIAETALKSYGRETDFSHNTYEFLNIATGRGGWHHQFGGLSMPINIWGNAYYHAGTVSAGFETWINWVKFKDEKRNAQICIERQAASEGILLVNMNPESHYTAWFDDKRIPLIKRSETTLELRLPANISGIVEIRGFQRDAAPCRTKPAVE